jgi:hypothetical protein
MTEKIENARLISKDNRPILQVQYSSPDPMPISNFGKRHWLPLESPHSSGTVQPPHSKTASYGIFTCVVVANVVRTPISRFSKRRVKTLKKK